tara:strand:+ start:569 stop:1432 length:864 start_codon:yes stop_codon:yes gene_type:complete
MADLAPQAAVPVVTDPQFEGAEGLVAPGQEDLVNEFLGQEAPAEESAEQLIGGKFKTEQDLLQAYQELEKRMGQGGNEPQQQQQEQAQSYTAEQAAEFYGEEITEAVNGAGMNLADLMWKADNGQDISAHYEGLAKAIGVPTAVVENYVSRAQAPAGGEPAGLSGADEAQLMESVGGAEAFAGLSSWAKENLEQGELADYNAVVDSGNKDAIRWALKALQSKSAGGQATEPRLIRGQAPVSEPRKFNSRSEVMEAMNKRDSRGRKLYEVDTEYQRKFAELLNNSDVF